MSTLAMRRGASSLVFWFGVAVLTLIMAVLVAALVRTMRHVQPVRATVPPVSAVVWGDRVFLGPGGLARWLKARGVGYSVWAERHPPADRVLKRVAHRAGHK